jgi:predicted nucleic acid-binding protein
MDRIFVDTGAWYAYFNMSDPDHDAVTHLLGEWKGRLLTTEYIFDEVVTLVRIRIGHAQACRVGEALRGGAVARLVDVTSADIESAWTRFIRNTDKTYSFTDCTSFVIMDRLGLKIAAAVDADFSRAGYTAIPG